MDCVVLLHSSAASARQWDALAERLRPDFDVRAIDLHGHGRRAAWPHGRPLSLDDEAALVLPVLERAGRVHLVGHSYGGAVAMYLAARYPERVRSLAVFEPVLFRLLADLDPQGAATREVLAVFDGIGVHLSTGQLVEAARTFVDYWSGPGTWGYLPREQQQHLAARMPSVSQQFHVVCRQSLPSAQVEGLALPVLCLSGARTTAAAARVAGLLRALLPGADHVTLPGMGHMGPITHAAAVNDGLAAFLAQHAGARISLAS